MCDLEGYRGTIRYIGIVEGYTKRRRATPQTHPSLLLHDPSNTTSEKRIDSREGPQPHLLSQSTERKEEEEERQDDTSSASSTSLSHEGDEKEKTVEMKSFQEAKIKEKEGHKQDNGTEEDEEDLWIGIEWDDASHRGKHDGSINGKRYFSCSNHIKQQEKKTEKKENGTDHDGEEEEEKKEIRGGSFVKRHKLIEPRSFKAAVIERYTTKLTQGMYAAGKGEVEGPWTYIDRDQRGGWIDRSSQIDRQKRGR